MDRLLRLRRGPQSPLARRVLSILAVVGFLGISYQSYQHLPENRGPVDWTLLGVLFVVGTPAMLWVNALEYRTMARLCSVTTRWTDELTVSIAATAANLLPIPGAAIIRSVDLHRRSARRHEIVLAMAMIGIGFVAPAFLATGLVLADTSVVLALGCGIGSIIAAGTIAALSTRLRVGWRAATLRVLATETVVLAVVIGRLWVTLAALGMGQNAAAAILLGGASVVATTLAFFPAGLGVREALSAALGLIVGLDAASGAFAAAVDRTTFLVGAGVVTAVASIAGWLRIDVPAEDDQVPN